MGDEIDRNVADATITRAGEGTAFTVLGEQVTVLAHAPDGGHAVFEIVGRAPNGPGAHRHPWTETYIVLEGSLRLLLDHDWRELHAGDSACVPGGILHTHQALDTKPCRFLVVTSTLLAETLFRAIDGAGDFGWPDPATVHDLAVRHGVKTDPM